MEIYVISNFDWIVYIVKIFERIGPQFFFNHLSNLQFGGEKTKC